MFIAGTGVALPEKRYSQSQCWEAACASPKLAALIPRSRAILKKVLLGNNGIATRHLALDSLDHAFDLDPDTLQARFQRHAPALATAAARNALSQSGVETGAIDGLVISTCTGYLCPGLTSYVSEALGLRSDATLLDLVGQGCGAALPNLSAAAALVDSSKCHHVLSVCVEVCSAAFYLDNDPGVLVSACLFGDGAAAAVCSGTPSSQTRPVRWKCFGTELNPRDRELLKFEQRKGMLRNILSPEVPALAAQAAQQLLGNVLKKAGHSREQIRTWIWHAGGRDVLLALHERLELSEADLYWSAVTLRDLGNISSPFVLHALQRALTQGASPGLWWLSSFGSGFSCHGALLEVG